MTRTGQHEKEKENKIFFLIKKVSLVKIFIILQYLPLHGEWGSNTFLPGQHIIFEFLSINLFTSVARGGVFRHRNLWSNYLVSII